MVEELFMPCPIGKVVLSCHAGLHPGTRHYAYPSSDGKGCYVSTKSWLVFSMNCADPMEGYEITSSLQEALSTTAECTLASSLLLGCGFKTPNNYTYSSLTSISVTSNQTCECIDRLFGIICFAICGKIWKLILFNIFIQY